MITETAETNIHVDASFASGYTRIRMRVPIYINNPVFGYFIIYCNQQGRSNDGALPGPVHEKQISNTCQAQICKFKASGCQTNASYLFGDSTYHLRRGRSDILRIPSEFKFFEIDHYTRPLGAAVMLQYSPRDGSAHMTILKFFSCQFMVCKDTISTNTRHRHV